MATEDHWSQRLSFFCSLQRPLSKFNGNAYQLPATWNIDDNEPRPGPLVSHIAMRPYKPYMVTPHDLGEGLQHTWHPWSRRTVMFGRIERVVTLHDRLSLLLLTRRQHKQYNRFFTTIQNRHIHKPFVLSLSRQSTNAPNYLKLRPESIDASLVCRITQWI
jgi:hypothetical protein